jgi:2-pyrone-4,6-dicarboxylate lactonase
MSQGLPEQIPCPPPRTEATPLSSPLPVNACDSHAHVFGPVERYPYQEERDYTPPDASVEALLALHDTLGVSRGVLIQPSVLGTDNACILDAVAKHPERLRAVVAFSSGIDEVGIDRLHEAGARGLRLNLVVSGGMPFASFDELYQVVSMIASRGWHVELLAKAHQMADIDEHIGKLPVSIVLSHYGYMPTSRGVDDPGFQNLLSLMQDGKALVKMTAGYRITDRGGTPYEDVRPFAEALLRAAPGQVLWGSDWPHVMCRIEMPDDGVILDEVIGWINDDAGLRQQVFVDNPAALYDFPFT